jgi:hypothetical protein
LLVPPEELEELAAPDDPEDPDEDEELLAEEPDELAAEDAESALFAAGAFSEPLPEEPLSDPAAGTLPLPFRESVR